MVLGAALTLVACTGGAPEVAPPSSPDPVASSPAADATLVCGIASADVELATGFAVGRVDDRLTADGGSGSGECDVFSTDVDGELLVVRMFPLDDPEAVQTRVAMDGGVSTRSVPDVLLDPEVADGAVWGGMTTPATYALSGPTARVFWGQTMVEVYLTSTGPGRSGTDELLAMAFQVAHSYDLG